MILKYYWSGTSADDDEDEEWEYEVDFGELVDALVDIIYDQYFSEIDDDKEDSIKDALQNFLGGIDNKTLNTLGEWWFYDELKEYFQDDADEQYWEEHEEI